MKENYEDLYHILEKKQWWFKSRRNAMISHLKDLKSKDKLKVLDIGCSIGLLINEMKDIGFNLDNITGIDVSENAIEGAKTNGVQNAFVMDAQEISFEENQFDIIVSSDCLEHLEKDEQALTKWCKCLKKGGKIVIYVPAMMSLWSKHDEANLHFRRYTQQELVQKAQKAGFIIHKKSYWNFFLFPPVWLVRKLNNLLQKEDKNDEGDNFMPPKFINSILTNLLLFENKLNKIVTFPFGVSTYIVATKK